MKIKITLKSIIIVVLNIFFVVILFIGIKKLVSPPEEVTSPALLKKEKPLVGKKEEKREEEKSPALSLFPRKKKEQIPVKAYRLSRTTYSDELPTVGTVKSFPTVELKFETNGVINKINVKEGDVVRENQVLASLDPKDVNLEVQWAEAKVASAKAEYQAALKRYAVIKKLYEAGAIIKDRLDQAQAEADVAKGKMEVTQKELDLSKAKLNKLKLIAPSPGIIGAKEKEVGEYVTPNDVVLKLWDPNNIFVEVGVIEKDFYKIEPGQKVDITVDSYKNQLFWGYVENVFPQVDERTRTVNVRIRVIDHGRLLRPGMFARAEIKVYTAKNAFVIPSSSLILSKGKYYVPVVEDGKVEYKRVSVEYVSTDFAVIKTGLKEGDLIVTETPGMKQLPPDTGVKIIETQEKLF